MYPYYKQVTALASGDTQAILTLYAAQVAGATQPPAAPAAPLPGPSVAIQSPVASATYATVVSTITISGTASDASGVASVTWANSTGGSGTALGTATWTAGPIPLQSGRTCSL